METKWKIDNMHSEVTFKVRHMMISNVTGSFTDFDAAAEMNDMDFSNSKLSFNASIASIQTGVSDRDNHLKSADFFDADTFPKLSFNSHSISKINDSEYEINGNMTLKGVEKPIKLQADYSGVAVDPYGQTKIGLSISGKIKRSDFGLTWSAVTEAGNIVVSDDVQLNCELQFVKQ